jgi:hypothetical protein
MRTITAKNYTQLRKPIAFGGTEAEPITPPVHATIHKTKDAGTYIVAMLTAKTAIEVEGSARLRVGDLTEAADAAYCTEDVTLHEERGHPSHSADERPPLYVTPSGTTAYCQVCAKSRQDAYRERKAAGQSGRDEQRQRNAQKREQRVAEMTARRKTERQRTTREHFAVVARNLLFGLSSGVQVNPDGSLTGPTGWPEVGVNTPMRGSKAQRRAFTLAQFTAHCDSHGMTVEQAAAMLRVAGLEQVSWKDYRKQFPTRRVEDDQHEQAA